MKTIEQLIFEKRFKDGEFDANGFNDWAKENEGEVYKLCLEIAREMQRDSELLKNAYNALDKAHQTASNQIQELRVLNKRESFSGGATNFEVELYKVINRYVNAGLKKPDLIHKMEYVTESCRVS